MKCPHCGIAFHESWDQKQLSPEEGPSGEIEYEEPFGWWAGFQYCPECNRPIIWLWEAREDDDGELEKKAEYRVYPRSSARPTPPQVPNPYRQEFEEACAVLQDSPKASAALSRRCLQTLLRQKAKTKAKDLADQIQEVLVSNTLPSHLEKSIDAVRHIGNFAAHPLKSKDTGSIMDVEVGEAEWQLDTLEGLFDFYIVQPQIIEEKRAALDTKLKAMGKPALK
jgi:hypothetical protein